MPLVLTEQDIRGLVSIGELVGTMEKALKAFSTGHAVQPLRTVLTMGPEQAYFGVMPAYLPGQAAVGTKIVTVVHSNHARGLPSHLATVLLFDEVTGALLAVMDGRYITEVRTGAVSAVSARYLAAEGPCTLAILGSGVQARSHLRALATVRPLASVRVWSPTRAHADALVAAMAHEVGSTRITSAATAEDACHGANLVVLATSSRTPVIHSAWVGRGCHVISVGAALPDQREMDPVLVARARFFVDSRIGALAESGDVRLGIHEGYFDEHHIAGELGELVAGHMPARMRDEEITIFKSLGMAIEDVATARLVFERARERGVGQTITL